MSDKVVIIIVDRWPVVTMTVAVPWSFAIQLSELNCCAWAWPAKASARPSESPAATSHLIGPVVHDNVGPPAERPNPDAAKWGAG
jgi:hypothetical protein